MPKIMSSISVFISFPPIKLTDTNQYMQRGVKYASFGSQSYTDNFGIIEQARIEGGTAQTAGYNHVISSAVEYACVIGGEEF